MIAQFNGGAAVAVAGVVASLTLAVPTAFAQAPPLIVTAPSANVRAERVYYHDLNLVTRAGEQSLHRRINHAVERVCLHDQGRWYGLAVPDYNSCADRAWRGARPQMIGAMHRARLAFNRGY